MGNVFSRDAVSLDGDEMLEVFRVELMQLVVGFVAEGFVIVAEISSDVRVRDSTRLDHFLRV